MRVGKLNPVTIAHSGGTLAVAKLNFPGFQKITDFTSVGTEDSFSIPVNGDTDKEYLIYVRDTKSSGFLGLRLNNDSSSIYGRQTLSNDSGVITASRAGADTFYVTNYYGYGVNILQTPTGQVKTLYNYSSGWSTGTTVRYNYNYGQIYNSTASTTLLYFSPNASPMASGTRIVIYARRTNT